MADDWTTVSKQPFQTASQIAGTLNTSPLTYTLTSPLLNTSSVYSANALLTSAA